MEIGVRSSIAISMLFIEIFVRISVAAISLFGAWLFFRGERRSPSSKWISLFLISVACGAVLHTAGGLAPPAEVRVILLPISSSFIVLLWCAAQSYFDDDFKIGLLEWTVFMSWLALLSVDYQPLAANLPTSNTLAGTIREIMSYGLVGHVAFIVLAGRVPDLVEVRRRTRVGFTLSILGVYLFNRAGETVFGYSALPLWFTSALYGTILALLFTALSVSIKIDPSLFETAPEQSEAEPVPGSITSTQRALMDRLNRIMVTEQAFLEPDLSIRQLAGRLGIAEHHLRALINQAMGHRNFRAYLNGYRVGHAAALLCSSEHKAMSVLDIAMASGFGSLASFNRVFKSVTGQSPRQMRSMPIDGSVDEKIAAKTPHFQK